MSILEIKDLQYSYESKKGVLRGINAQMEQGKMYAMADSYRCQHMPQFAANGMVSAYRARGTTRLST